MFELVFLTGPRVGEVVSVVDGLIAGRSPDCTLHTPDLAASRHHARIHFDGKVLQVEDKKSANGTFVGERRVDISPLQAGDVLRIGNTRLSVRRRHAPDEPISGLFSFTATQADPSATLRPVAAEVISTRAPTEAIRARLAAVLEVSKALVLIDSLENTANAVLDALFGVFPQANRTFLMLGSEAGSLRAQAYRTRGQTTEAPSVSVNICRKVLESRSAILFDDKNPGDLEGSASISNLHIRSAMAVPLLVGDEVLGILQVDTSEPGRTFGPPDLEIAIALGRQAAIAVRNALLVARVERETRTRDNLLRFLPGPLVEQTLAGDAGFSLGGRTYLATVMFSDIEGFTALSENLRPDQVVELMNGYFNRMVPCVEAWGGSVDKFIGDAIMAVWGIPAENEDAALRACLAALAMQSALVGFNSLQAAAGRPALGMGIGINTGAVVGGNIGTETRKEYTVLGDAVNTAQRLETAAGKDQVLIADATWEALDGHARGVELPSLTLKNKSRPLKAHSLRGVVVGDEVALHLPARSGDHPVFLIRRLADRRFLLLHPPDCDPAKASLVSDPEEWRGRDLGRPEKPAALDAQATDGHWVRSEIHLADETLAGLLEG
jgi:adenylate cyclase